VVEPLIKAFPEYQFYIAGSKGKDLNEYPNVKYLGWLADEQMKQLAEETPVYVRFTEHDGMPSSIVEALANGSEVIWNHKFSYCHYALSAEDAIRELKKIIELLQKKDLDRNKEAIHFIAENYSRNKILSNLLNAFETVVKQ
jgi:hypothetical protein